MLGKTVAGAFSGAAVATGWWLGLGAGTDGTGFPFDATASGALGGGVAGAASSGTWQAVLVGGLAGLGAATLGRYLYLRATS